MKQKIISWFKKSLADLLKQPLYVKYQAYVLPSLVVLISLNLVSLVIIPQVIQAINNQKEIIGQQQKLTALNTKIQSLSVLDTKVYTDNLNVALIALPKEKDIPATMTQVLYLINSSSLQLTGISFSGLGSNPDTPLPKNTVPSFNIKLSLVGSLTNVKNFIQKVNDSPRLMKLSSLDLATAGVDKYQANLAVDAYFQALPNLTANIEKPLPTIQSADLEQLNKIRSFAAAGPIAPSSINTGPKGKPDPFQ